MKPEEMELRKMEYGVMSHLSIDDMVLMIMKNEREDDPNSGLFTLPGGKLKAWEKGLDNLDGRLEAAVRETQEETGLILINPLLRGVILFDNNGRIFDNWQKPTHYLVYMFGAEEYVGELKSETEEGRPLWVSEIGLPSVPKSVGDEKIYEWLRDPRYFMGIIRHKGKVLDEAGTFVTYFD
jgi:8-oxo-dGTP diphosphatase